MIVSNPSVDNGQNSIYFHCGSNQTTYQSGTTGTWVIGNNIAGNDNNSFSICNPKLDAKKFTIRY